jgi:hypothetical protein
MPINNRLAPALVVLLLSLSTPQAGARDDMRGYCVNGNDLRAYRVDDYSKCVVQPPGEVASAKPTADTRPGGATEWSYPWPWTSDSDAAGDRS